MINWKDHHIRRIMIDTIHSYSSHSIFGIVAEGIPALLRSLHALVNRVALAILIQVVISIPLFYLHHNLCALGFIVGFIFDKQVREVVEKVNVVYSAHRTLLERVLFFWRRRFSSDVDNAYFYGDCLSLLFSSMGSFALSTKCKPLSFPPSISLCR